MWLLRPMLMVLSPILEVVVLLLWMRLVWGVWSLVRQRALPGFGANGRQPALPEPPRQRRKPTFGHRRQPHTASCRRPRHAPFRRPCPSN